MKPPSQSVVLSLIALILLSGAPALVSVIDDSTYDDYFSIESPLEMKTNTISFDADRPEDLIRTSETVITPEGYVTVLDSDLASEYVKHQVIRFDPDTLSSFDKITFVAPIGISIYMYMTFNEKNTPLGHATPLLDDDGERTGVHEFIPSSAQKIQIASDKCTAIGFDVRMPAEGAPASSWAIEYTFYDSFNIPYGEIIIGATGALLIICALFATPWFGIGGVTAKPRRSK